MDTIDYGASVPASGVGSGEGETAKGARIGTQGQKTRAENRVCKEAGEGAMRSDEVGRKLLSSDAQRPSEWRRGGELVG